MNRLLISVWCAVVTLGVAGCGRQVALEGVVTLDGKPVEGAGVSFAPADGSVQGVATGKTDAGGVFHLGTRDPNDGVRPGEYIVLVYKTVNGPGGPTTPDGVTRNILPAAYESPATSPLRIKVPHDGPVRIELTSPKK